MRTTPISVDLGIITEGDTLSIRTGAWNGNSNDPVCFNAYMPKTIHNVVRGELTYIDEGLPKAAQLKLFDSDNKLVFNNTAFLQYQGRNIVEVQHVGKPSEKV